MTKQYFSTGDVAKLLHISRATVSRKFDSGHLAGIKNPITNERMISRQSILEFAKQFYIDINSIEFNKKHIFVISSSPEFAELVQSTFAFLRNNETTIFKTGGEAPVSVSENRPDICIIDDAVTDIAAPNIIKVMQNVKGQKPLHIIVHTPLENRGRYSDLSIDDFLYTGGDEETSLKDIIYPLLSVGREPEDLDHFTHRRKQPRLKADIPVSVDIIDFQKRTVLKKQAGIIRNISLSGAYLANLEFHGGLIPSAQYYLRLLSESELLADWQAEAKVVRIKSNHLMSAGIQFTAISEPDIQKIKHLISRLIVMPYAQTSTAR